LRESKILFDDSKLKIPPDPTGFLIISQGDFIRTFFLFASEDILTIGSSSSSRTHTCKLFHKDIIGRKKN